MNTSTSKMNWLVEKITKCGYDCKIVETGSNKGTVLIPTGGGKSGIMYINICYHIANSKNKPGKYVFNISAPILKLCQQLVNDLFEVISIVFDKECDENKFQIFINSSDDASSYLSSTRKIGNVYSFDDFDRFIDSKIAKYAFVISCHKSLYKFAEKIDYINKYTTTFNYIDESHLIYNLIDEPVKTEDSTVLMELNKTDYMYAFSATPDAKVSKIIKEKGPYIINVSPADLIKDGIILKPFCKSVIEHIDDGDYMIKSKHCKDAMEMWTKDNPYITHKILVSCENTDHLKMLENELKDKYGYKVFSTCAKEGTKEEMEPVDPVGFINAVDNCNENCFVLHIKQLREGIDIKTLTGCIISNRNSTISDPVKVKYVQTIGRVLRPLKGERGIPENEKVKKCGYVLFVLGDAYDRIERDTFRFIVNYYGLNGNDTFRFIKNDDTYSPDCHKRDFADSWGIFDFTDDEIVEINELKGNVIDFLENKIGVEIQLKNEFGISIDSTVKSEMMEEVRKHFGFYDGMFSVNNIISDRDLMSYASNMLDKLIKELTKE